MAKKTRQITHPNHLITFLSKRKFLQEEEKIHKIRLVAGKTKVADRQEMTTRRHYCVYRGKIRFLRMHDSLSLGKNFNFLGQHGTGKVITNQAIHPSTRKYGKVASEAREFFITFPPFAFTYFLQPHTHRFPVMYAWMSAEVIFHGESAQETM